VQTTVTQNFRVIAVVTHLTLTFFLPTSYAKYGPIHYGMRQTEVEFWGLKSITDYLHSTAAMFCHSKQPPNGYICSKMAASVTDRRVRLSCGSDG
jgi:hypothetical protein